MHSLVDVLSAYRGIARELCPLCPLPSSAQEVALATTEWVHFRLTDQYDAGSTLNNLEIKISGGVGLSNLLVLVGKNEYPTVDSYFIMVMGMSVASFVLEQFSERRKVCVRVESRAEANRAEANRAQSGPLDHRSPSSYLLL